VNHRTLSLSLLFLLIVVLSGAEPGRKTIFHPVEQYLDSHGRSYSPDAAQAKMSPGMQREKTASNQTQTLSPSARQDDYLWTLDPRG